MKEEDKCFKALLTIAIPILVLAVIVFGCYGIMNLSIHSLINSIGAGVLIPILLDIRSSL